MLVLCSIPMLAQLPLIHVINMDNICCLQMAKIVYLNDEVCDVKGLKPTRHHMNAVVVLANYVVTNKCPYCGAPRLLKETMK